MYLIGGIDNVLYDIDANCRTQIDGKLESYGRWQPLNVMLDPFHFHCLMRQIVDKNRTALLTG